MKFSAVLFNVLYNHLYCNLLYSRNKVKDFNPTNIRLTETDVV